MKHYVIGDVHGAGDELVGLLAAISPRSGDRIILVGDVFDRAMRPTVVWRLIRDYNLTVLRGNHEQKLLQFLLGRRPTVPPHYMWALTQLLADGVTLEQIVTLLDSFPLNATDTTDQGEQFVVAHAGARLDDPTIPDQAANLYGDVVTGAALAEDRSVGGAARWYDLYSGSHLVCYGHFVTADHHPRFRPDDDPRTCRSVGLDTGACHGGPLSAICVETREVFQNRIGVNWFRRLREELRCRTDGFDQRILAYVSSKVSARLSES